MANIRHNIKIHVVLEDKKRSRKHFSLNQMCARELLPVPRVSYLRVFVCVGDISGPRQAPLQQSPFLEFTFLY